MSLNVADYDVDTGSAQSTYAARRRAHQAERSRAVHDAVQSPAAQAQYAPVHQAPPAVQRMVQYNAEQTSNCAPHGNRDCGGKNCGKCQSCIDLFPIFDGYTSRLNRVYPKASAVSGYYQFVPNITSTSRTFVFNLVGGSAEVIAISQNPAAPSANWAVDANLAGLGIGDVYAIGGLGTFGNNLPTPVNETIFNSWFFVISVPDATSPAYYLQRISVFNFAQYVAPFDLTGKHYAMIQIRHGSSAGIYYVDAIDFFNCTWTLVNTNILDVVPFVDVHIAACVPIQCV